MRIPHLSGDLGRNPFCNGTWHLTAEAHGVAIVSRSVAEMMGGALPSLGREVQYGGSSFSVVGVVSDLLFQGPVRRRDADFDIYVPLAEHPARITSIAIATRGEPADFIEPLSQRLGVLAPSSALHWISRWG